MGQRPDDLPGRPLVLVVEDDPETRQYYLQILSSEGFSTEDAHNGLQALEKARVLSPDLVLTDIAVPGIDGIELCRRLRAEPRTRDISLLAVTGYDDRDYQDRAIQAGADHIMIKPVEARLLCEEVRRLVHDRRSPAAASTLETS